MTESDSYTCEAEYLRALRTSSAGELPELATAGVRVNDDGCDGDDLAFCGAVLVTLAAGENWDEFVQLAVSNGWVGVEALHWFLHDRRRGDSGESRRPRSTAE